MTVLRRAFASIMKTHGINVYLQRRIYDEGVGLFSIPANSKNSYFSKKLEKFTVRYVFAGRKTALTSIVEERTEGEVHTINRVFYFPHFANPREGDRIYIPDSRYEGHYELYLVDYAQPERGDHGQIEYWYTGSTRSNPN